MKKLSRVLFVLCLLTVLVCAISITAHATEVIDAVYVTFDPQVKEGDPIRDARPIVYNPDYKLRVSYSYGQFDGDDPLEMGVCYNIRIMIDPHPGYAFTADTRYYLNGELADGLSAVEGSYYFMLGEPITELDIPSWPTDIQPGHPGQDAPVPVPEGANYSVTARWRPYGNAGTPTQLQDGKLYELYYIIKPNYGYYIDDNAIATMDGQPLESFHKQQKDGWELKREFGVNVEYVDHVDITYTRPRYGDLRSDFKLNEGGAATMGCFIYVDGTSSSQPYTFEEGICYMFCGALTANTGYAFSDQVTVTFNGKDPITVTPTDRLTLPQQHHKIQFALPVDTVEFPAFPETVAPGIGGTSDLTSTEFYSLKQCWMDLRTGETVDTLEAGDVYTLAYIAEPAPGYIFSEDTVATVGGESCYFSADTLYLLTYHSYDLGAQKIDRIDVTLPKLYKGYTFGNVNVPEDANYTIMETMWAESTTGSIDDSVLILSPSYNTSIFAIPVLVAKEGYIFSEDVKVYFNGQEIAIEDFYAEGPILEVAGACGTLTPPTGTGWYQEDNTWAYYEKGVKAVSRWIRDSIDWCYVNDDGLMVTNGFARDSKGWCYLGADGYMVYNRWVLHNGDWYFINQNGYRLQNTWKRDSFDWCYLGADGKMLKNAWQRDSKGWCYVGGDGYMVRNQWAADSHGICRLNGSGYMVYNTWILDPDGWRYVDTNGYMVYNGWTLWKGYWYAFDAYGVMFSDTLVEYKGKYYRLEADGRMLTSSWFMVGKYWTYVNADGYIPLKTWVRDSKGWCYIGANGYMLTNSWVTTDGKRYYVGSDGRRLCNTTRTFYEGYLKTTYTFDHNGVAKQQSYF